MVAVMPSLSTAYMSDISEEVSTATMLPLGNIKSGWTTDTERRLMKLLKTEDKVRILSIMKKLYLDGLKNEYVIDIIRACEVGERGDRYPNYPAIYLFYLVGKYVQEMKNKTSFSGYSDGIAWRLRDILQNSNPNPTQTEYKLMEKEAWDYINSL